MLPRIGPAPPPARPRPWTEGPTITASKSVRAGARRITEATVKNAKLPVGKVQHDIFDSVLPGFGLRIGKRRKTWFVMVRALKAGTWKLSRVTLGTTAEIDLASARQQARDAQERARQGKDPTEVRTARQQAVVDRSRDTFAAVRSEFLKKYIGRQQRRPAPRTMAELRRTLESDLFTGWQHRPLADITRRDVLNVLDTLTGRGSGSMANRTLAYLRLLFKWAEDRAIVSDDPTAKIKRPGAEHARERILTVQELRIIWQATDPANWPPGDLFTPIVRVLLLTGQRRNEVGGMAWSEIDNDTWTLPAARAKNGRTHVVPLSAPVLRIIQQRQQEQAAMGIKSPFVFATSGRSKDRDSRTRGGNPFANWSRHKALLDDRAALAEPWRLHDLRRSFVTHCAESLHIAPHILEAVINHISGSKAGVAGIYNRALHLDERRKTLDAWPDYLLRQVGETHADNVVELVR
ncbi:tyrosine-type recombinase/integrase [Thiohalocapsa marina]|uniref:tyrosine-type recombinase/integrase n=1 Tax=Thiohalocapsa marina TaxID=424902 RepID=UPI0036D9F83A